MRKQIFLLFLLGIIGILTVSAQKKEKLDKLTKSDFAETHYDKDPDAPAAVLYKSRQTYYDYDSKKGWILVTEIRERVHIFKREGFEYATKRVNLFVGEDGTERFDVKAATYNLVGGKVKKTPLENKHIFKETKDADWKTVSFTLPDVKEGSIVEWHYEIRSPYAWSIDDMVCQYDIPIRKMTGYIQIPEYFIYNIHLSRYHYVHVNKSRISNSYNFSIGAGPYESSSRGNSNSYKATMMENVYEVELHNVPALEAEPYVNSMRNYRAKLQFELSASISLDGKDKKFYNSSWETIAKTIYEEDNFGKELKRSAHFMPQLNTILAQKLDSDQRIRAIFDHVKNQIIWNGEHRKLTDKGIAEAYKNKEGNSAEINLNLIAMLKKAGLKAYPVLISTRDHGVPRYPTKKGYNSVIAGIEIGDKIRLLDATDPYSTPDLLPIKDLNWKGTLIREDGTWRSINLYPNKLQQKDSKIRVSIDNNGLMNGNILTRYEGHRALEYRTLYANSSNEDYLPYLESKLSDIEIINFSRRNEKDLDKPIVEVIEFESDGQYDQIGDKIYISPFVFNSSNDNPFQMEKRKFPIDFAYPWQETTSISIAVPDGYKIISIPDKLVLTLPDAAGSIAVIAKKEGNDIVIQSDIRFNQPIIEVNRYEILKQNFQKFIDHQEQKIVLEKDKNLH